MKKILSNKKNIAIFSVILAVIIAVSAIVIVSHRNDDSDTDVDTSSTTTTEAAGENVTDEESTTTSVEESSETSDKTQEEETTEKVETTTKKKTESTTVKKTESTTKKTETTTKKETTTKASEMYTENAANLSDAELRYIWSGCLIDGDPVTSEEEYYYYINTYVPNYKCEYCGDHNCPSITYEKNRLGDTVVYLGTNKDKCPAIKAEKIKCPNNCGRILVAVTDERWYTESDKYCDGSCHLSFS